MRALSVTKETSVGQLAETEPLVRLRGIDRVVCETVIGRNMPYPELM